MGQSFIMTLYPNVNCKIMKIFENCNINYLSEKKSNSHDYHSSVGNVVIFEIQYSLALNNQGQEFSARRKLSKIFCSSFTPGNFPNHRTSRIITPNPVKKSFVPPPRPNDFFCPCVWQPSPAPQTPHVPRPSALIVMKASIKFESGRGPDPPER
jgi:hypothetical protein